MVQGGVDQRDSNGPRWRRSAGQQRSKVESISGTATVQGGDGQRDSNGPRWSRSAGQQRSKVETVSGTAMVQSGGDQRDNNGPRWSRSAGQQRSKVEAVSGTATVQVEVIGSPEQPITIRFNFNTASLASGYADDSLNRPTRGTKLCVGRFTCGKRTW
ncbi:uncharacterized protein LOC126881077 [Diabrotica virgifera virgifera]|uniref:Uncharacterized protein n=1 Tax=Diabrotica virgifera virgifera TaxID=50390 RepID=A0ABM5JT06_DIAVI|nr:uncharacterized protein LOC126881077 [Diabrotica virgifera virgifera]